MAKMSESATVGKAIPYDIITQLEKTLPPELIAQLQLPAKQEEFTLAATETADQYFNVNAAPIDTVAAAKQINEESQFNMDLAAKKQSSLASKASAAQSSARSQFKAAKYLPTIPRRYTGGR